MIQDLPLSSKRWVLLYHEQNHGGKSVFQKIRLELPHLSDSTFLSLVQEGAVYCNGARLEADLPIPSTARIEIFEPKPWYRKSLIRAYNAVTAESLVYRDESFAIAVKPAGLPTLPTRDQSHLNFKTALMKLLPAIGLPGAAHIPSRLDAPVMGLIPVGIGQPASGRLQRQMERGEITKEYKALVEAQENVPVAGVIELPIARAYVHAVLRHISAKGQAARTEITSVEPRGNGRYLLTLQPITGRTHQLRLHCAASGFPIVGDQFYNPRCATRNSEEPLHLVCRSLSLPHPITRVALTASIPSSLLPDWL